MKPTNVIQILTAILVFLVALGSFVLSYNALQEVAVSNGISGWLSYIWPLLIDFALIVFSLSVVNAYLQAESTGKQWALVGVYTLATIGFNILHAPDNLQARIVASIAPISLFFSFELLMGQLRNTVKRQGFIQSFNALTQQTHETQQTLEEMGHQRDILAQQIDQHQAKLTDILAQQKEARTKAKRATVEEMNQARQTQIDHRREQVLTLHRQGMTQQAIADELDVSITTIKRDLQTLNGKVSP